MLSRTCLLDPFADCRIEGGDGGYAREKTSKMLVKMEGYACAHKMWNFTVCGMLINEAHFLMNYRDRESRSGCELSEGRGDGVRPQKQDTQSSEEKRLESRLLVRPT